MNIEQIVKVGTVIGSALGTIAFFQNIAKEVTSNNKEKWKKLEEVITILDLDNLQYQITARKIRGKTIEKVERLYYLIEKENQDYIGFKSIIKNKIKSKLALFNTLYDKFREHVQVPYWNPFEDKDDEGNTSFGYKFDKEFFFDKRGETWTEKEYNAATKEYAQNLSSAENITKEMEKALLDIQKLSNKDAYELILPWKWR